MTTSEQFTDRIKSPVIKAGTAIAAAGGANSGIASDVKQDLIQQALTLQLPDWIQLLLTLPWGSIASMAAAMYTTALFLEWFWKKPVCWVLVKAGIRKPITRYSAEEWARKAKEL